jgi:hypothetical protein
LERTFSSVSRASAWFGTFAAGVPPRFLGTPEGSAPRGGSLFAAITKARRLSRSTGAVLNPQDPDDLAGRYALMRLDPETLETRAEMALDPVANEVYDLLAAGEEASSWPLLD